jgi:spore coat protein CotH
MKKQIYLIFSAIFMASCSLMSYDAVLPYEDQSEDGLSIFYIHPKPVSGDYYTPVTVIYKGETYEAEGKIRGGVSAYYPKKSYTLKFDDDNLFSDPDAGEKGFTDRKKLVLASNFDDNSYIRNRLAFWMWNQMDDDFQIDTFSSPVYLNGSYEGLYTVIDFIDEYYLDDTGFDSDGDMFKGTTDDADFYMKSDLVAGFEKKTGLPEAGDEGSYDSLESFITTVNESSDTEFDSDFETYADVESYYDWWFFTSFMKAWDSTGKNSYHYLNPDDSKWYYIPWDFNQSFGQSWDTSRTDTGFNPDTYDQNGIFYRLINSDYKTTYDSRYSTLLETGGELEVSDITAKITELYSEVETAAKKDFEKWEDDYMDNSSLFYTWSDRDDYTTVDEEIDYIKNWVSDQYDEFIAVYP